MGQEWRFPPDEIRRLREDALLTRETFALRTGITLAALDRAEQGLPVSVEVARLLKGALPSLEFEPPPGKVARFGVTEPPASRVGMSSELRRAKGAGVMQERREPRFSKGRPEPIEPTDFHVPMARSTEETLREIGKQRVKEKKKLIQTLQEKNDFERNLLVSRPRMNRDNKFFYISAFIASIIFIIPVIYFMQHQQSKKQEAPPTSAPQEKNPLPEFPTGQLPAPSATQILIDPKTHGMKRFGDVITKLLSELRAAGYDDVWFFRFDNGVAAMTLIERMTSDGFSEDKNIRWEPFYLYTPSRFWPLFQAVFRYPEGRFRFFIFTISTMNPPLDDEILMSTASAVRWARKGNQYLPRELFDTFLPEDTKFTALIYDIQGRGYDMESHQILPSPLRGRDHLIAAHLQGLMER